MSNFPHQPPVALSASGPNGSNGHDLSSEELTALPLQALLVRTGMLTLDQLSEALRENVSTGRSVEDIAVGHGWVSPDEIESLRRAKAAQAPPPHVAPAAPPPLAAAPALEPLNGYDHDAEQPEPQPDLGALSMSPPAPVSMSPPPPPPVSVEAAPPPPPAAAAPEPVSPPFAVVPTPPPAPAPEELTVEPEPQPVQVVSPAPVVAAESVGVFLNLVDGSRIWVGRFDDPDAGLRHAEEIIDSLMRPEPGQWARFGNRLIRPDSVVGLEISPRRDD